MARISVITITYTVFLSFLYLVCKGWQTTISSLSRNQATNLTMIMGGVYLTYSAYFLSVDFETIYIIMNCVMVALYGGLAYVYARNSLENISLCNSYINEMVDGEANIMRDSLLIKRTMLRWICVGSTGFCLTKIILYGVINNMGDEFITYKLDLITQGLDFVWVTIILIVCRPRKQWPAYFTLSVHEMRSAEGRGGGPNGSDDPSHAPAPLLVGLISEEFLFKQEYEYGRTDSIGSDDAVLFLNPVKYTLDVDDTNYTDFQKSAFDEDIIEETAMLSKGEKVDVEADVVQKGLSLGCKDKRQLKR